GFMIVPSFSCIHSPSSRTGQLSLVKYYDLDPAVPASRFLVAVGIAGIPLAKSLDSQKRLTGPVLTKPGRHGLRALQREPKVVGGSPGAVRVAGDQNMRLRMQRMKLFVDSLQHLGSFGFELIPVKIKKDRSIERQRWLSKSLPLGHAASPVQAQMV